MKKQDNLTIAQMPHQSLRALTIEQMKHIKGGDDSGCQNEDEKRRQRPGGGVSTQSPPISWGGSVKN